MVPASYEPKTWICVCIPQRVRGDRRQPDGSAMTPTSQGAPKEVGSQATEYLGDFRRLAHSLASATSEDGK